LKSEISRKNRFQLTIKHKLVPAPVITPVVMNKRPIFLVENPLKISPTPNKKIPVTAVHLAPRLRIILAFSTPKKEIHAVVKDPTNDSVEGEEKPLCTSAACRTPQLYEVPTNLVYNCYKESNHSKLIRRLENIANHHVRTAQDRTITQPYPPSGASESAR